MEKRMRKDLRLDSTMEKSQEQISLKSIGLNFPVTDSTPPLLVQQCRKCKKVLKAVHEACILASNCGRHTTVIKEKFCANCMWW